MKIKNLIVLLLTLTLMMSALDAFASGSKIGTAGAVELTIPMGARNVALSGADIAGVGGNEAMYWNPAGVATVQNTEASFSYLKYFADMTISYFTVSSNVGQLGVFGLNLQALNIGDINVTTIEVPEGTGEVLKPNYLTLGGTFARSFTDRINFGMNAKFISERIGDMTASAFAFDFGLQYRSPFGVDFGVVMKNYGSTLEFSGSSVEFDTEIPWANPNATTRKTALDMAANELPASMNLGLSYDYNFADIHKVTIAGTYANNSYDVDKAHVGVEYSLKDIVFGRIGYVNPFYPDDYPDSAEESQFGLSLGFGIHLLYGGHVIMFDYAYRDMDLFDANQYFTLGISL